MASEKQIAANRKNATKSTGPRTQKGKARSKMNALRHGLAASNLIGTTSRNENAFTDPCEAREADNFEILQTIRAERMRLMAQLLDPTSPNSLSELLKRIAALQRYDGKAYAIRKKLQRRSESS
ncbi:hypothetical protein [Afipia birgiae]|jgi:hypothetical protein|uniref:hypothetical protein n=1 Tax=Afipia birgiae TaxID=151414 RepID=UPI00035FBA26|nr:hypothetical protein [Afipia birgiae]